METALQKITWRFRTRSELSIPVPEVISEKLLDYNTLIESATDYLEVNEKATLHVIGLYRRIWKSARIIMAENHIYQFNDETKNQILTLRYGTKAVGSLTSSEWRFRRAMNKLIEFLNTGRITLNHYPKRAKFVFEGPLGQTISEFFKYMIAEKGISKNTIRTYEQLLSLFHVYCINHGITSAEEINQATIIKFITAGGEQSSKRNKISNLRCFLRYVHEIGLSKIDLSLKVPMFKQVILPKLPSVYQKEEIETLLSSIERRSSIGKRNYAIIILAAKLGLRANDIACLKFESIDWTNNNISIIQSKTERELSLPLIPEVGNAIIDYLKYARPKSNDPFIFLQHKPPYKDSINSNIVTHIVQRAFLNSGVSITGRRFGSHSLRHSLGFRLLQDRNAISVISEVLGHKSTDTTKRFYLRIDLKSMEPCALEVSPISKEFYEQLGGIFYDKET